MPPTYQDVEQVIRSVSGVASASIGAVGGTGRGRLRIRLEAGHDPDAVSKAVAATLRERFGIDVDPAAIRPRPAEDVDVDAPLDEDTSGEAAPPAVAAAPAPSENGTHARSSNGASPDAAAPSPTPEPVGSSASEEPAERSVAAAPAAATSGGDEPAATSAQPESRSFTVPEHHGSVVGFARPMIQGLSVGAEGLEVHVQAVLTSEGRELRGRATGAATRKATLRAVARATLDAVEQLFPGRVKTELESLELSHDGEDEVCTASVTFLTSEGAEKLIGISIVRGDAEHAVMRSTLDAVNRRIGIMLEEAVAS